MSYSEVTIRPYAERDAEPIAALLRSLWSHDPTMLALYAGMHRDWQSETLIRRTLVATAGHTPIGAGTIFESTIHPRMLFVALNIAEDCQRRGVGSRLWAALEALGDSRPWLVKMTRRDKAGMSFLCQRGFQPLVGTLTGVLDPAEHTVQMWLSTLPREMPDYRIAHIDDTPAARAEIALIHAAIYRQAHDWNPPAAESVDAAIAHYCGPSVISGSQLCVYHGDRLVGAANLIAHPFQPDNSEAYLVNLGVVNLPPAHADRLTGALIRRSLEFAGERGLSVQFEADDPHQPFQTWLLAAPASEIDHDFTIMGNG